MNTGFRVAACLAAAFLIEASASAATVFGNTNGFTGFRSDEANNFAVGDRAALAGTERLVTEIRFEYFVTPGAGITGSFDLWALDAAGFPTGTSLFSANLGTLPHDAFGYDTANIDLTAQNGVGIVAPNEVTWSVIFSGIGAGTGGTPAAGLLFYGDVEVGSSADNFYRRTTAGVWEMVDTPGEIDNFAVLITAVPEPSTWALLVGGLGALAFWNRRRTA